MHGITNSIIYWCRLISISSEMIIAYVMDLPTLGPALLNAALTQDMYLVGAIVMILSALTVFGTLVSDLLLVLTDPRIKY